MAADGASKLVLGESDRVLQCRTRVGFDNFPDQVYLTLIHPLPASPAHGRVRPRLQTAPP